MSWIYFQQQWALQQNVTFDGINRLIIIGANTTEIDVKTDIYSNWKEWVELYENAKFLPAIRTTGGDPIGGGEYTGDVYFLINNWRVLIDHSCNIDGVLYSDNYPSPYLAADNAQIVTNKVSAIVQTVTANTGAIPTPAENAAAVWGENLSPYGPGTAGNKLKQGLTTGNFIALK